MASARCACAPCGRTRLTYTEKNVVSVVPVVVFASSALVFLFLLYLTVHRNAFYPLRSLPVFHKCGEMYLVYLSPLCPPRVPPPPAGAKTPSSIQNCRFKMAALCVRHCACASLQSPRTHSHWRVYNTCIRSHNAHDGTFLHDAMLLLLLSRCVYNVPCPCVGDM